METIEIIDVFLDPVHHAHPVMLNQELIWVLRCRQVVLVTPKSVCSKNNLTVVVRSVYIETGITFRDVQPIVSSQVIFDRTNSVSWVSPIIRAIISFSVS